MSEKITIHVKKLDPEAIIPTQAHDTDAGYDMYALNDGVYVYDKEDGIYLYTEYRTGIAIEPAIGYHIEIPPRSSLTNKNLLLKNSLGIIDNIYRGEIRFRFYEPEISGLRSEQYSKYTYKKGDKIGQILIRKTIYADFVEVDELSSTERGEGGFGSSDKKKDTP